VTPGDDRLPHGYTNKTRRVAGFVEKQYEGRDAKVRLRREAACLRGVASVLPVPEVVESDEVHRTLRTTWIEGTPGQERMRSSPRAVLGAAGSLLRQLQSESVQSILAARLEPGGPTAAHGDFGPQNLLLGAHGEIVALCDWEFARMGDAVDDIAWAEWIVRTHHAATIDALDELFNAYGMRPAWQERHESMVAYCELLRRRCHAEGLADAEEMWVRRLDATERWSE
jgi:tRNA A-37 threonylcarbamoyl transferase component Bud32